MSDQDFFFDEDDQTAEKPAAKPAAKPASKPAPAASRPAAPTAAQTVSYTVAALIGVCTLLLGVIIGMALPGGGDASTTSTTGTTSVPSVSAPQLSPEEMENGVLPEGHPDIGASAPTTEDTATAGGSEESTTAE